GCGRRAVRPHAATDFTASTPNKDRPPQPRAWTDGSNASARSTPSRLRLAARSRFRVAASAARTSFASAGAWTPRPFRTASASDFTTSRDCQVGLVPARAARTSARAIVWTVERNWATGTIGTLARTEATAGVDADGDAAGWPDAGGWPDGAPDP